MLVSEFVPAVLMAATRKIYTFTTVSDTKAAVSIAIANQLIQDWQNEPNVDWNSLYIPDCVFSTVTAAQTFSFPPNVRKLSGQESDVVRILHVDGTTFTDYDIIDHNRAKDYANGMRTFQDNFVIEANHQLVFNRAFNSSDPQFGGTIYVQAYGFAGPNAAPNFLVNSTDEIPVDDPNWLVYATAAQYDANDVTRQQLVPRLETKANALMDTMKANNDGQLTTMLRPWRPAGETLDSAFGGYM